VGGQLLETSASLGAILRDARDLVNILPPTPPLGPTTTDELRDGGSAAVIARAKARLAGLRLVVVEEEEEEEQEGGEVGGRGPFRIAPRTVLVAKAGERCVRAVGCAVPCM
jgi:hypothetical protein